MSIVRVVVAAVVVVLLGALSAPSAVRAEAQAVLGPQANVPVTLKLTVVISRFNGEKKVGSLPFLLMVVPGPDGREGESATVQTGANVPVPQTTFTSDKTPQTSYSYRQFGTNISSSARALGADVFNVGLNLTDSQLLSDTPEQGQYAAGIRLPRYQSFSSNNRLILRDGQTIQYTAATDKTSGEVIRVDVTLNVIK